MLSRTLELVCKQTESLQQCHLNIPTLILPTFVPHNILRKRHVTIPESIAKYVWHGDQGILITVLLTSCLTGLESAVWQLTIFVFICKTDSSKPVKQEVNGTMILPPLVFPAETWYNCRPLTHPSPSFKPTRQLMLFAKIETASQRIISLGTWGLIYKTLFVFVTYNFAK